MPLTLSVRPLPLLRRTEQGDGASGLLRLLRLTVITGQAITGGHCILHRDESGDPGEDVRANNALNSPAGMTRGISGVHSRNVSVSPRTGSPGDSFDLGELQAGVNEFRILVPEAAGSRHMRLRASYGNDTAEYAFTLSPARRWTVSLVLHSHTDLGFTAPVSEVAQIHNRNTDAAVELCRETEHLPAGERFKWTCEVTWQIQNYLRDRTPAQVEELMRCVRNGAIEIGGLYAGEHTDLLSDEESVRSLSFAGSLRRRYGIPIDTVLLSDVPGCTSGFVQLMAKSGIRNFLLADNNFIAPFLPRTDLPRPFRWRGADNSSVLCWYTDHPYYAYVEGEHYGFNQDPDAVLAALPEKLAALEGAGYPYSSLQIQYAFDNAVLDARPAEIARAWNRLWESPRIVLGTPREFFRVLESEGGSHIPVRQGDWTSWWASISPGFPAESALTRALHDRLPAVEVISTLVSLHDPSSPPPVRTIDECYDCLLAFDEHSGGGGVWKPRSEEEQTRALREGYGFLYNAKARIESLEQKCEEGLGQLIRSMTSRAGVVVLNLLPWNRSASVKLAPDGPRVFVRDVPAYGFRIVDDAGDEVQNGSTNMPLRSEQRDLRRRCRILSGEGIVSLENPFLRVTLERRSGRILSVRDLVGNQEVVRNDPHPWGLPLLYRAIPPREVELGRFIPEIYDGTPGRGEIIEAFRRSETALEPAEFPDAGAECVLRHRIGGIEWSTTRLMISAYDDALRLETTISRKVIDDAALRQVLPELGDRETHIYLPLPFNCPGCSVSFEAPASILSPPGDQFKGACMDFYAVQHWLLLSGVEYSVALASPDAPLVDIGSPGAHRFKTVLDPERSTVFVRLASLNGWGTPHESPFSMGDDLHFRFAIAGIPCGVARGDQIRRARRLGWEMQNPLRPFLLQPASDRGPSLPSGTLLTLEPETVQLLALKPPQVGEGIIIRLLEKVGEKADVRFAIPGWRITGAKRVTLTEDDIEDKPVPTGELRFSLAPHGVETFRCTLEKDLSS